MTADVASGLISTTCSSDRVQPIGQLAGSQPTQQKASAMGIPIPRTVQDVTTEWLNAALKPHLEGHFVQSSEAVPFSEPGQTADIVEITLHYGSSNCALPDKMIAKLAATAPETREMCATFKLYERETGFYGSFPTKGLPIAKCFHADFDPATLDMVILMEHLAPSYSPGYAISVEQVRLAIQQAATLHSRWWNDDFLKRQPALVQLDDPDHWRNTAAGAASAFGSVRRIMGDECEASIAAMEAYSDNLEIVMNYLGRRPFALQHSDFHAKQMFFPSDAGGRFAIIDWQFSVAGPAAWDIARIINLGLKSETRSEIEDALINEYLELLKSHGVADYGRGEFLIDYKIGVMFTQLINFIAVAQTDTALLERECAECGLDWKTVWLLRGERMIEGYGIAEFLRSLPATTGSKLSKSDAQPKGMSCET
ncbi:MAG: phosphotransferase [Parvibaculaceae bacterium]